MSQSSECIPKCRFKSKLPWHAIVNHISKCNQEDQIIDNGIGLEVASTYKGSAKLARLPNGKTFNCFGITWPEDDLISYRVRKFLQILKVQVRGNDARSNPHQKPDRNRRHRASDSKKNQHKPQNFSYLTAPLNPLIYSQSLWKWPPIFPQEVR